MIYDQLEKAGLYFSTDSRIGKALRFARAFDIAQTDGKYEIEGQDAYAIVRSYATKDPEAIPFEAHRVYADIHLVLSGAERMDVVPLPEKLAIKAPYDAASDCLTYKDVKQCSSVALEPGVFCLCYPHDVHRPSVKIQAEAVVRKMVLKVKVS